jgi:branched-chain amino acid transport system ATP-binding protein
MVALLEIENLQVSYGKIAAVHGISLRIEAGEVVSIIGANGAGKSTLLNAISGVLPYIGDIYFAGSRLPKAPHAVVRCGVVQVPEGRHVFSSLSVD